MTTQFGSSGGWWFDSAVLDIQYDGNKSFQHHSGEAIHIKKSPHKVGRFVADLSSIPCDKSIDRATLTMTLNKQEGIANSDQVGSVEVRDGNTKEFVRNITAAGDIHGKGYQKYTNPRVKVDFTAYARKVHQ